MLKFLSKLKKPKEKPSRALPERKQEGLLARLRNRFSRKEKVDAKRIPDFGGEYRKQRSRQKRAGQFKGVVRRFGFLRNLRPGLITLGLLLLIFVLVGFVFYSHSNGIYILQAIEITGTKEISDSEILSKVEHLRGGSLFSFSESGVEEQLKDDFPYIKNAEVRKQLPGTLLIDIEERFPIFSYINLTGVYLVDDERVVVNSFEVRETDSLTEEELLIIDGYGDPNADFVHDKYLSGIDDEEERKKVKWDEVEDEIKENTLRELRNDLIIRVQTRLSDKSAALAAAGLERLTKVEGFDAEIYEIGGLFPSLRTDISRAIIRYLKDLGATIDRLVWQSDFSVRAELGDGLDVIFSSTRDIQEQLDSLEVLRIQGELKNATQVDLRSELVAVK